MFVQEFPWNGWCGRFEPFQLLLAGLHIHLHGQMFLRNWLLFDRHGGLLASHRLDPLHKHGSEENVLGLYVLRKKFALVVCVVLHNQVYA